MPQAGSLMFGQVIFGSDLPSAQLVLINVEPWTLIHVFYNKYLKH